jgi:uncharacterized RDD family membrane protein YckC
MDLEFEVPEFYRRLVAWLLDVVLLFFYLKIAFEILKSVAGSMNLYDTDARMNLQFIYIILWAPIFIYHPLCEITMNGQSLGKKIMGLQVVNENGGRPSISQFLIRWLIRTSDQLLIIILLYNVMIFYDKKILIALIGAILLLITDVVLVVATRKSQRLGDILARTILIRNQPKGSIEDTVFMAVADNYIPVYPQIMQLSDRDINAIKSILETARKKNDLAMASAAAVKIKDHLRIQTRLPPFEFLEVLLKDYNYLSVK